jgi:alpha-tubulin suppressor-like RCC1 family protein
MNRYLIGILTLSPFFNSSCVLFNKSSNNETIPYVPVENPSPTIESISANLDTFCVIRNDGSSACSDSNYHPLELPQHFESLYQLSLSYNTSCGLALDQKTLSCFGSNFYGERGEADPTTHSNLITLPTLPQKALSFDSGQFHHCLLNEDLSVSCFGWNGLGQLGDGTDSDSYTLKSVSGVAGASQISSGLTHNCALINSGKVRCWGSGLDGELGQGLFSGASISVEVESLSGVRSVVAGSNTSCALVETGDVHCWGDASKGLLGLGAGAEDINLPHVIPSFGQNLQLAKGDDGFNSYFCTLKDNHEVYCWGKIPQLVDVAEAPIKLSNFESVGNGSRDLMISGEHICIRDADKKLFCLRPGAGSISESAKEVSLF